MAERKPHSGGDHPYLVGDDGLPIGGPSDIEIAHAAETRFHRDMQAALEHWQAGDITAFTNAMRLCRLLRQPPPRWLLDASEALVERAMAEDEKRARRAWHVHLTRWEAMTELLERAHELSRAGKANLARARELISSKATTDANERARLIELLPKLVEAANDDRGTSVERASEAVSKALKATDARGEARTIKASYEIVEAAGGERATFESYRELLRRRAEKRD